MHWKNGMKDIAKNILSMIANEPITDNDYYVRGYENGTSHLYDSIINEMERMRDNLKTVGDYIKAEAYQECINIIKTHR